MKIVSAVELDAHMTLVKGDHNNDVQTSTMCLISVARSLKRIADALDNIGIATHRIANRP